MVMKRSLYLLLFFLFTCVALWGQEKKFNFSFSMVRIDSTYDAAPATQASRLMTLYRPELERRMMTVVGYAPQEMRSFRPESPLSNFAADALLTIASQYAKEPIDFSLTNFGGLRASFRKGDVRLYDIYAVFPFENALVILEMEGKDVEELFNHFARTGRVEAVGNVRAEVKNGAIQKLLIAGQPFDPHKRYKMATIDFLLGGGDNVAVLKNALSVVDTGIMIRDAVVEYISMLKSQGKDISAPIEGRVKIVNE